MQFIQSTKKYPELYIPKSISSVLCDMPTFPPAPQKPKEPIKPIDPGTYDDGGNRGCTIFMLIVFVGLFFYLIDSDKLIFGAVLNFIFVLALLFFEFKMTTHDRKNHRAKQAQYKEDLQSFPDKLRKHNEELSEYTKLNEAYSQKLNILQSQDNVNRFRRDEMKTLLTRGMIPQLEDNNNSDKVKKGASEDFFLPYLKTINIQETTVLIDRKIPIYDKYYYPDFVFSTGLIHIIIEIDEPYAGSNGDPIHYIEDNYGITSTSIDHKRNDYCISNDWVVIRFAEEQIFRYPDACISFIKSVIDGIANADLNSIQIDENFEIDKWTKEISHQMAYKRYRHSYVPYKYQHLIDVKEY